METLQMLYFVERDGGMFVVSCEDGTQWTSLPAKASISGVECYKDCWNSVNKEAYYREI